MLSSGWERCSELHKPVEHGREEREGNACPSPSDSPLRGLVKRKSKGERLMVCVLDQKKRPLMPCTPKRARLLLARGRAVVHRVQPFVIRLKDRRGGESVPQPLPPQIDPGSKNTGMARARAGAPQGGGGDRAPLLPGMQHPGP